MLVLACNPCENEVLEQTVAPGGREYAILFHRSCGAMGPGGFEVSILPSGRQLAADGAGNVFDVDRRPQIAWTSDSTLTITYLRGAKVRFQAIRLRSVTIDYVPNAIR